LVELVILKKTYLFYNIAAICIKVPRINEKEKVFRDLYSVKKNCVAKTDRSDNKQYKYCRKIPSSINSERYKFTFLFVNAVMSKTLLFP
jgi:hypothetical protein